MLALRPAQERGTANIGWLNSAHSFSFGNYYDPNYMGFASLRVINEDIVAPGQGFATHGHRDMEIVTYVLDGALEHKDSLGNGSVIRPGDIQRMSAGTGILHSEYNPSPTKPVHLLQIWLLPNRNNLEPSYEQVYIAEEQKTNQLRLIGSSDGRDGSVTIHQDVNLYATQLQAGATVHTEVSSDRAIWVQVARGEITLNDQPLVAGDGAGLTQVTSLTLTGVSPDSEVLLFDMARLDTAA